MLLLSQILPNELNPEWRLTCQHSYYERTGVDAVSQLVSPLCKHTAGISAPDWNEASSALSTQLLNINVVTALKLISGKCNIIFEVFKKIYLLNI